MSVETAKLDPIEVSVVIPAKNEEFAIESLVEGIFSVFENGEAPLREIIVIDDGSDDGTANALDAIANSDPRLKVLHNAQSIGQSASIREGVMAASGNLIVTLDGDGQNPPDQIPLVIAPFLNGEFENLGLVQGERQKRRDNLGKKYASKFANGIRGGMLQDGVRDSGCGLKAFRRDAYLSLPWFNHIHRFMGAMMLREGWDVLCVPVAHQERQGGVSKYSNFQRGVVGFFDLFGVRWLTHRRSHARKRGENLTVREDN